MKTLLLLTALVCQHDKWETNGNPESLDVHDIGYRVIVTPEHYHGNVVVAVDYGRIDVEYGDKYDVARYTNQCHIGRWMFRTNGLYRCYGADLRRPRRCLSCGAEYATTNSMIMIKSEYTMHPWFHNHLGEVSDGKDCVK